MKESEMIEKCLNLAKQLKKLWNMKVTVKLIVGVTLNSLQWRGKEIRRRN